MFETHRHHNAQPVLSRPPLPSRPPQRHVTDTVSPSWTRKIGHSFTPEKVFLGVSFKGCFPHNRLFGLRSGHGKCLQTIHLGPQTRTYLLRHSRWKNTKWSNIDISGTQTSCKQERACNCQGVLQKTVLRQKPGRVGTLAELISYFTMVNVGSESNITRSLGDVKPEILVLKLVGFRVVLCVPCLVFCVETLDTLVIWCA